MKGKLPVRILYQLFEMEMLYRVQIGEKCLHAGSKPALTTKFKFFEDICHWRIKE